MVASVPCHCWWLPLVHDSVGDLREEEQMLVQPCTRGDTSRDADPCCLTTAVQPTGQEYMSIEDRLVKIFHCARLCRVTIGQEDA